MAKIQGLDSLNRRFREMIPEAKDAFRKSLQQGAEEIVASMRALAPVDDGALKASIRWTADTTGKDSKGDEGLRYYIIAGGRGVNYAAYVEFGTQDTPANPFFFPAYRLMRKRVRARVGRTVGKAIRDSFKRGS